MDQIELDKILHTSVQNGDLSLCSYLRIVSEYHVILEKFIDELTDDELSYLNKIFENDAKLGYNIPIKDIIVRNPKNVGEWIDDK